MANRTKRSGRIPTTLLGGYLGAGKTTLINRLLSADHQVRVAVLVNDFGSVNIDADLIRNVTDQTISLTNGCVCCSISDDLGAALDAQTARSDPPEHIVIEASGVADPNRIVKYAEGWPGVQLDSVVTVADVETLRARTRDKYVGGVVRRQLEAADILILNKTDLIGANKLHSLRVWLRDTIPSVRTAESRHGAVDPLLLIGPGPTRFQNPGTDMTEQSPTHFATVKWLPRGAVSLPAFEAVLDALPDTVHRLKGFVRDQESSQLMLVQVVGKRRTVMPVTSGANECIVAIGASKNDLLRVPALLAQTVRS